MRFFNKYKLCSNFDVSTIKLSKRLFDFKRPKWFRIKKKLSFLKQKVEKTINLYTFSKKSKQKKYNTFNIKKQIERKKSFFSYLDLTKKAISTSYRGMPKLAKFHKNKLQIKKYFQSLFDNSIHFRSENNTNSKIQFFSKSFVKPFFRIDLLLWYLNYFSTSYQAIQQIHNHVVLVNEKKIGSNFFVKKGDVISFSDKMLFKTKNFILINQNKYFINHVFFTFLEIDYYSNIIVIIKDFNELSAEDLTLLIEKSISYQNLLKK